MRVATFALFCLTLGAQDLSVNQLSLNKQAALGRQLAEDVRRNTTAVADQAVQDYVAQLGARLARQLPDAVFPDTFSVIASARTNALHEAQALPGGYVFVPVDLLLTVKDEAEFAGMLAQSMARGPLLFKGGLVKGDSGTIPIFFVGGADSVLLPAGMMKQLQSMELQVDTSAVSAMSRAGFDPGALLRYIERVQPPDGRISQFPPRAERLAGLRAAIQNLPPADTIQSSDEFYRIQELARAAAPAPPAEPRTVPSLKR
jgi:predicted Zn-dependent protease